MFKYFSPSIHWIIIIYRRLKRNKKSVWSSSYLWINYLSGFRFLWISTNSVKHFLINNDFPEPIIPLTNNICFDFFVSNSSNFNFKDFIWSILPIINNDLIWSCLKSFLILFCWGWKIILSLWVRISGNGEILSSLLLKYSYILQDYQIEAQKM